ncbi:(2Fe-2S)-binding protein [Methanolobus sediminis]|uniref:(2Fe-2S)-binding protein n=1 Tax=Methanolobus sediminis TaxID=3072978 RepID=A0AA51UL06_9EURY|nr:(2Fe-2S)-binding protein [Methanolobus sediminis]WMW25217.1 (2Fe-2S)-binding protein [Methanolobus sediminis]
MNKIALNVIPCETNLKPDTKDNNSLCPVCSGSGSFVKNITVRHMISDDLLETVGTSDYCLCMNEDCQIAYYNIDLKIEFKKSDIKVPIWFKKDAKPKYACYCSKVTEEEVITAVINDNATSVKEVIKITGAMNKPNCQINNPSGKCCHQIIQEIIDKTLK